MSNIELNYTITTDSDFLNEQNAITPELSGKLESFHKLAIRGKKSSVKKILDAIEKYPNNPQLKNYLSVLYSQLGETQKLYDVNKWIIEEHPNYLFGKLNMANEYFSKEEYDKMPLVLGPEMEIKALYPDREIFHLNEVISYLKCAIFYFIATDNVEQAEVRYDIMYQLAPDTTDTDMAFQQISFAKMIVGQRRLFEEEKNKISVKQNIQKITAISTAPKFNHQEMEWLYSNGLYIEKEKLNKILSLPRVTLVQDLKLVLEDSIIRYGYFNNVVDEDGFDKDRMTMVIHSIYILGELKAIESIDTIFNVLSQSVEYLELYLGEFVTSMLWEPLYNILSNNLELCKQFMFKPGINTYARSTFPEIVVQIALHHPERHDEAVDWFADVIDFFLISTVDDNVIDCDLIGLLICNINDMNGSELLPRIEKLFEKEIVSKSICGDWEEVKEAFIHHDKDNYKREILSITERYDEVSSSWVSYTEEEGNFKFDHHDYNDSPVQQIKSKPKIGRNQPCPCGSGKKYKKCCLNK